VSVGPGTSMSVDLDDRAREILNTAAVTSETGNTPSIGARRTSGNPSPH